MRHDDSDHILLLQMIESNCYRSHQRYFNALLGWFDYKIIEISRIISRFDFFLFPASYCGNLLKTFKA